MAQEVRRQIREVTAIHRHSPSFKAQVAVEQEATHRQMAETAALAVVLPLAELEDLAILHQQVHRKEPTEARLRLEALHRIDLAQAVAEVEQANQEKMASSASVAERAGMDL